MPAFQLSHQKLAQLDEAMQEFPTWRAGMPDSYPKEELANMSVATVLIRYGQNVSINIKAREHAQRRTQAEEFDRITVWSGVKYAQVAVATSLECVGRCLFSCAHESFSNAHFLA